MKSLNMIAPSRGITTPQGSHYRFDFKPPSALGAAFSFVALKTPVALIAARSGRDAHCGYGVGAPLVKNARSDSHLGSVSFVHKSNAIWQLFKHELWAILFFGMGVKLPAKLVAIEESRVIAAEVVKNDSPDLGEAIPR
jgi:hypothetical protein